MRRAILPVLGATIATSLVFVLIDILFIYLTLDAARVRHPDGSPPVPPTYELLPAAEYWFGTFLRFIPWGALWSVAVVIPALFLVERFPRFAARSRVPFFLGVPALAGIALVTHQLVVGNIPTNWSAPLVFGLGFTVGLAGTFAAETFMPPNTSLERTRER